ncbi:MAG: hypothetical protein GY722_04110 [bacterium]|nr:hypothetical protein [bacterium]
MPTREELVAANVAIRKVLDDGAETKLRAIPGVEHVSVGLKVKNSTVTDELCIHVYVVAKRPHADLDPAERIPQEIEGVRTDVNEIRRAEFTIDTTRYRPLKGGCLIGNEIIDLHQSGAGTQKGSGTFGCMATRTSDGSPVLLSNWHVLMKNGARIGEPIFQPPSLHILSLSPSMLPRRPVNNDDAIAFIVDAKITNKVDAGIARLDVSSCCRCCGLDFRDEIVELSAGGSPPSNGIIGKRAAVPGSTVYKVGAASGRTVGRIVTNSAGPLQGTLDGVNYTLNGQLDIASQDTSKPFSTYGDSGAVIIDDDGYVVGLLFAQSGAPPNARTYANHIDDVCTELGIEINYAEGHSTAGARTVAQPVILPPVMTPKRQALYEEMRGRLMGDPAGAWLWDLAEEHREEVVRLINTERRVSVVWHRVGGPAVFAESLERLQAGDYDSFPTLPSGAALDDALARLGDALAAHGSEALKAGIDKHGSALVIAAGTRKTLSEFLAGLHSHAVGHVAATPPSSATMVKIEEVIS